MRRPDDARLTDSREYPWLSRTLSEKDIQPFQPPGGPASITVFGENRGQASLLSVSPIMAAWNYRNPEEFAASLNQPLLQAHEAGLLDSRTVVIFPEHIGLFLYLVDEFPWVTRSPTLERAGLWAALDEKAWIFFSAIPKSWDAPYPDAVRSELMRLKAARAAEVYQASFSSLAQSFRVTVVGGSLPLPGPEVVEGRLRPGRGASPLKDMKNVSALFRPDGTMDEKLTMKRQPTSLEASQLWMKADPSAPIPLYDTPAGKLAILICADAWHPGPWESIRGADVLAVPSLNVGSGTWEGPWLGYDMEGSPDGLPEPDGETLAEAWSRYAIPGRSQEWGLKAAAASFLKGRIFDLEASGVPLAYRPGPPLVVPRTRAPQLVKVWLPLAPHSPDA